MSADFHQSILVRHVQFSSEQPDEDGMDLGVWEVLLSSRSQQTFRKGGNKLRLVLDNELHRRRITRDTISWILRRI